MLIKEIMFINIFILTIAIFHIQLIGHTTICQKKFLGQ